MSERECAADRAGARRPAPVRGSGHVHHDRAHRVRLARGRLLQGRRGRRRERARTSSCARRRWRVPPRAIDVEEVEELLPWQLRGKEAPRRVEKTFMFTDIEGSTNLVEALGDEAWQGVLRWHDETLRSLFAEHSGEEVVATGDGFFVGFDSPDDALACAVAIQRKLAEHRRRTASRRRSASACTRPARRRSDGTSPARACTRPRASRRSRTGTRSSRARTRRPGPGSRRPNRATVTLRGTSEPMEIVTIEWN